MSSNSDPIKHVILLLLENRSFDEMLGCFRENPITRQEFLSLVE